MNLTTVKGNQYSEFFKSRRYANFVSSSSTIDHLFTGYGRSGGTKTTAAELTAMFESMQYNELLTPARLLTGSVMDTDHEILRQAH